MALFHKDSSKKNKEDSYMINLIPHKFKMLERVSIKGTDTVGIICALCYEANIDSNGAFHKMYRVLTGNYATVIHEEFLEPIKGIV
jgi:hypothetical protein